jgi:hypothetical protein
MLALYFFFIIRIFPSIVLTSWNSLLLLTTDFAQAQVHSDVLGMMAGGADAHPRAAGVRPQLPPRQPESETDHGALTLE